MEKYLPYFRKVAIAGIFLVPFIALIVSSSLFFPFITGKNFLFRFIVEIIFGCWAVLAIYDKKYRPGKSLILYFSTAFVALMALSTFLGVNPERSFWSNYERMEGLVTFLHMVAYFVVLVSLLRTEKIWKTFFNTTLAVSVYLFFYGFLQLSGALNTHQGVRLDATLGNAAYFAIYAVFHIFLALFLYFKEEGFIRWIYPPIAVLGVLVLYYTATRGAILGLIGGAILAGAILFFLSEDKKIKKIGMYVLGVVVLTLALFWFGRNSNFVTSSPVLSRFSSISVNETTTQSRLVIWQMAYEGFKEHPVLGWGPENFNLVFNKYYEPILYKQEQWFDRAHNVFFDRLTSGGILGLVSYLGLFASALYYLLLKRKEIGFSAPESALFVGLLAAYFVHNIFVFDNLISLILFFSVLAYLDRRVDISKEPPVLEEKGNKNKNISQKAEDADFQKSAIAITVVALTFFVVYYVNAKPYAQCRSLLVALNNVGMSGQYYNIGDKAKAKELLESSLNKFKEAINYGTFGVSEAREQLVSIASGVIANQGTELEVKQGFYNFATSQMEDQISKNPLDIRYKVFLGSLYNRGGQFDSAIKVLSEAVAQSPMKQSVYFELASSYLNKKDFAKSEEILKNAFELDKTYDMARIVYAVSLINSGKTKDASALLVEGFGTDVYPDDRLVNAYYNNGEFAMAAAILEELIKTDPSNVDNYTRLAKIYSELRKKDKAIEAYQKAIFILEESLKTNPKNFNVYSTLAAIYSELGMDDKTIEALQRAIEANPAFKEQGEFYIKQVKDGVKP